MRDKLLITGLEAVTRLGTTELEQETPQTVWVDLELAIDARRAAARDYVTDAIDYAQVVEAVRDLLEGRSWQLLETAAEQVATLILRSFGVPRVRVKITKRALEGIEGASVEISRRLP